MVAERLKQVLLRGDGAGELAGPDVRTGRAEHPVCGDCVELSVRFDGEQIRELRWRASGCPASMAVAALAGTALRDVRLADAGSRLRAALDAHGGLQPHERHAEALLLRALQAAVGS